jgi:hypothetical protein
MILHKCHEYYEFCDRIADFSSILEKDLPETEFEKQLGESAFGIANDAIELLEALGDVSPTVIGYIVDLGEVWGSVGAYPLSTTLSEILSIKEMVRTELESRKFLFIPSPDDKRIRQTEPFGKEVYLSFPTARIELTNAFTAFAVELYTACIFHLMRATEISMRALCNDRRIAAIKGSPVHMMEWHEIISALEAENLKIANWPKTLGEIRVQAQEFYNGATSQFRGIKDEWRNHVSHTRSDYSRGRAEEAIQHVKILMQTLATRISETSVTPTVWTTAELR